MNEKTKKSTIINIGGAINAGKSTVGKLLEKMLPDSVFIEVDDLLSDEEEKDFPSFEERILERLNRLYRLLAKYLQSHAPHYIIFAYPMGDKGYRAIKETAGDNANFVIITLNPPLAVCLSDRGTRKLSAWEQKRIGEMYRDGMNAYKHSDLIIDNGGETPEQTAGKIADYIVKRFG